MILSTLLLLLLPLVTRAELPQAQEPQHIHYSEADIDDDDSLGDVESDQYRHGAQILEGQMGMTFSDHKSFACPLVKPNIHTGSGTANLSPEDIDIVAAMGDALATGKGLFEPTDVEFRGAAFPIGGDANIDGLVTIPNILHQFNDHLSGVSHGMGTREQLPPQQFNVAQAGAESDHLPEQAKELVRRLRTYRKDLKDKWVLVTVAVGTEELCNYCDYPHHSPLRIAMGALRKGIPKALVVLLGPVHVASSFHMNANLLRPRCKCLKDTPRSEYAALVRKWADVYYDVQNEFSAQLNYTTFSVLAIPQLTIHSRNPDSLFLPDQPLLNRKGHTYAAKWLWNRLMTGPGYNVSELVLSTDTYYCPSVGCPYFRTPRNLDHCSIVTKDDWKRHSSTTPSPVTQPSTRREKIASNLPYVILAIVGLALISVTFFGTIFYRHGLEATKGRFEELTGV